METELKMSYTTAFTNTNLDVALPNTNNMLQPRILIGTTGCIGAGLDCKDVHYILRMGTPSSIIGLIQEMGRCGRNVHSTESNTTIKNSIDIVFNIKDYIYLYERCYHIDSDDSIESLQDCEQKNKFIYVEIKNLRQIGSMMFLESGCWHVNMEQYSTNIDNVNYVYNPCLSHCPYCTKQIESIIKTVSRIGVCVFLVQTMINTDKKFTPIDLGDELYKYPNAGRNIYNRPHAIQPQKKADCYMTIIQLILVGIIKLKIEVGNNPKAICILAFDSIHPKYNSDECWTKIRHN